MDVEEPTKGGFTRLITNSILTGIQKSIGKAVVCVCDESILILIFTGALNGKPKLFVPYLCDGFILFPVMT